MDPTDRLVAAEALWWAWFEDMDLGIVEPPEVHELVNLCGSPLCWQILARHGAFIDAAQGVTDPIEVIRRFDAVVRLTAEELPEELLRRLRAAGHPPSGLRRAARRTLFPYWAGLSNPQLMAWLNHGPPGPSP
ncbi:hypothetical protein [Jannaschia sp. R86511]|uniref:hypothetical protein n=1 Tax=Jannaschia sp. R86511 TaxID=3093853 RepID=UPI0036D29E73